MCSKAQGFYDSQACCCIGPQNGEPLCPCMMRSRGIYREDGHWIQPEKDLGPITENDNSNNSFLQRGGTDGNKY